MLSCAFREGPGQSSGGDQLWRNTGNYGSLPNWCAPRPEVPASITLILLKSSDAGLLAVLESLRVVAKRRARACGHEQTSNSRTS